MGLIVLAAIVLCPLMAVAAPVPAVSSCHEAPTPERHGDSAASSTCCATVAAADPVKPLQMVPIAVSFLGERGGRTAPRCPGVADLVRPRSGLPLLFVLHACLLI